MSNLRYVGLDVHAETIAVAIADAEGEVRSVGVIPNRPEAVAKQFGRFGARAQLRVCYEAGPCGFVLQRQLTHLGIACDVIAPTLIPMKAGDRVKTDRRDALKLARSYRAGELTPVYAPAPLRAVIAALQTLRGVRHVVAATVVSELGTFTRFLHPRLLMGYSGLVPREHSSGGSTWRGGITKTGNAHLRRVLIEAAWAYRHGPSIGSDLQRRQQGQPAAITALAWQAQRRLCTRFRHLVARGKPRPQVATAVARELLGFMWAIGSEAERLATT